MELGQMDKNNKIPNLEGPVLNTFYKACEKIKYANQKRVANEKVLRDLNKR